MSAMDCSKTAQCNDWMQAFARRCQLLAGQLIDTPGQLVLGDLQNLLCDVPPSLPEREILFVRTIAARCLFETMRRVRLETHPIVTRSITLWVVRNAEPTPAEWQQCAGRCTELLRLEATQTSQVEALER